MTTRAVDPILLEVVRNRLETIADEMELTLLKSAASPIVKEGLDASAALFTGAKVTHLGVLPQGQPERPMRAVRMTSQARAEGFGHCTTIGECEAVCPAGIKLEVIARMNRDFLKAVLARREEQEPVATVPRSSPMRFFEADPAQKVE